MRVYGYEVNTPTRQLKMQANKESFKNAYLRIVMRVLCTNNVSLLKASKRIKTHFLNTMNKALNIEFKNTKH
ncbi:hypothetical protein [Vibrio jasicida]|uniref:hypothetical protein n=1 Tax=Vibrio jasicida TaxID=766224 RepID=UPI0012E0091F|nr:hypothetical protein [Vibrio jasicida]